MVSKIADPTRIGDRNENAEETTPLLIGPESISPSQQQNADFLTPNANGHLETKVDANEHDASREHGLEKPMPYLQIILLCYSSLAEPVAYFAIFPFINEMIERTGNLDEKDVGFWSGMIESLFSLVQMVLMIVYGRAADRLGRKPVLVFSVTGIGVATALFGMSQTLWQMILTRCLAGVFAGSAVTVRTMISENCTKATQGRAFSWYMFARNLGIFIGPVIGGALANPAEQFPKVFGNYAFFVNYPYALATYVAGAVVLCSALLSLLFQNETLKRKVDGQSEPERPMTTWEVMRAPGVPIVLYIYGHLTLLGLIYTAVCPVFMFTSVDNGGFGFSDQKIAAYLALAGISQSLWMLLGFPALQKAFSTGNVMRGCSIAWPVLLVIYPTFNEFLRHGWTTAFWVLGPIVVALGSSVAMGYACIQLFINDVSPSSNVLATMNALALTVSSGVRAFAPVVGTSIFAVGVKWGFADGHLIWILLVLLAAGLNVANHYLPEAAEGKLKEPSDEQS